MKDTVNACLDDIIHKFQNIFSFLLLRKKERKKEKEREREREREITSLNILKCLVTLKNQNQNIT